MGITQELCRRIAAFAREVGTAEIATAKTVMLDAVCVALAGSSKPLSHGTVMLITSSCGGSVCYPINLSDCTIADYDTHCHEHVSSPLAGVGKYGAAAGRDAKNQETAIIMRRL